MVSRKPSFYLLILLPLIFCNLCSAAEKKPYRAVFHVHTAFSQKGRLALSEISSKLIKNNIDAAFLADDALKKVEWGAPPWRNIIKKRVSVASVFDIGVEAYLRAVELENLKHENVLIIQGLQVNPHYYWRGNPFQSEWELYNANKDMILLGFKDISDWAKIPVIHNEDAYEYSLMSLLYLWPFIFIVISLRYIFSYNKSLRVVAYVVLGMGVLFAADYFPYKHKQFNQYDANLFEKPFQHLIDYANKKGGLIFWSHPESAVWENRKIFRNLTVINRPYVNSLKSTHGYTGFGYFQEGSKQAGRPGGVWDEVLLEYSKGYRASPVWAVGELDLTDPGKEDSYLKSVDNIIYADSLSEKSLLKAVGEGAFYVRKNKRSDIVLSDIILKSGGSASGLGGFLTCSRNGSVTYSLKISDANSRSTYADAVLIKNSRIVREERIKLPGSFIYKSKAPEMPGRDYYRLEIKAQDGSHLVLNPIFAVCM